MTDNCTNPTTGTLSNGHVGTIVFNRAVAHPIPYTSTDAELHDQILRDLSRDLQPKRFNHVLGVLQCSLSLASIHGFEPHRITLAALLHDCAKHLDRDKLTTILQSGDVTLDPEDQKYVAMWHGPAGAVLARTRYGVADEEILDAIANHTVGRKQPSVTLMLLMAADSCEPTRSYAGVEELRDAVRKDLKSGLLQVLNRKVQDVVEKGKVPHMRIFDTIKSLEL